MEICPLHKFIMSSKGSGVSYRHGHKVKWTSLYIVIWTLLLLMKHGTAQGDRYFEISEGLPVGTLVGSLSDVPSPAGTQYAAYPESSDVTIANVFNINEYGEIRTEIVLDRETRASYSFVAVSLSTGSTTKVTVIVLDENDNSPVFAESIVHREIAESTPPDAKYSLGSATDDDIGINSTQKYEILEGNTDNKFRLSSKRAANGILYMDLEINGELDHEAVAQYNLLIQASDGGSPPRTGLMRLNITITDVNDNQPIFNVSRYSVTVDENAVQGTPVLTISATDRDSGENGKVLYFIDRTRSDEEEIFDVNPNTGLLFINKKLDFEVQSNYELVVVARDNGTAKLQTSAVVSVKVTDVNDNEPTIDIVFLTEDKLPRISEESQPGDYVARISVSDPDLDEYDGHVNVTLNGGDGHFGLTTRDNVVYLVLLYKPLDRELKPVYHLTVVAVDSGSPPKSAIRTIQLQVTDTNDNPPEFTHTGIYYADIQEIGQVGSSVIQVSAIDRDQGNNSKINYELKSTPETHSDWFSINNETGLITTRTRIDCETASEPVLTVVATDSGVNPLSASATVIVRIHDVNDNQPVFEQSFYDVAIPESQNTGSCILTVSAVDPDCGLTGSLQYKFGLNLGPSEFEIRASTGEICITSALDYETKSKYEFPVTAVDQDGLDSNAMVRITIQDVNDNRPSFGITQYNVNLEETSIIGTEIVAVRAMDADSGDYGTMEYSISSGNQQQLFAIDSSTGVITLEQSLVSADQIYTLSVSAKDGGGLQTLTPATVTIRVLDPSQKPPAFSMSLYQFSISESASVGTRVGTVSASNSDPDAGTITYSVLSGGELFTLDAVSGDIRSREELDHDTLPYVLLTVQAQSGNPATYAIAQVLLTIYKVQAQDADSGLNGQVWYRIQDSSNTFTISETTGQITLKRALDYETEKEHILTIRAYDRGSNSMESTMRLIIKVQDVNDNAPIFNATVYTAKVAETMPTNTRFLIVNATDKDTGNNGRVTYLLQNGPGVDMFGIFPDTGYLYNHRQLDQEVQDEYHLIVVAMDTGIPPRSATAQIIVSILDENDNSPIFSENNYHFSIAENEPSGTLVAEVSASDPDLTDGRSIKYTFLTSNDYFLINDNTGRITTKTELDREAKSTHQFTVKAYDTGVPPRTALVNVEVEILDRNDNDPKFTGPYSAYVEENQPKGTVVIVVSARDSDSGNNAAITYFFPTRNNPDASKFQIHYRTGEITTREVLDYESRDRYPLTVVARDGGNPAREAETIVEISIVDINESPPQFDQPSKTFTILENKPPGTSLGYVTAQDPDSGANTGVTYYIIGGNLFGTFAINRTTGEFIVERPVDFEMFSSYSVVVRAVDSDILNPMSSTIVVNITVLDVNDNAPRFEDDPVLIHLQEHTPLNTPVYQFRALDADSGSSGQVRYTILSQAPTDNWFSIDSSSGVLRVIKPIDYEDTSQISVVVMATDQPPNIDEALSSTVTAIIPIQDINDNTPIFKTRSEVNLMEDEPVGYPIMHVVAVDADNNENGRVSYGISSGNVNNHFTLDPSSGLLSIASALDREDIHIFRLNVTARDHGYPQRAASMTITLFIVDVNDNPPQFLQSVYNTSVQENKRIDTFVTRISATDPDTDLNAELEYLIPYGIADNHFQVEMATGELTTNATLDRERRQLWTITAYVRDRAYPAQYDTTTVLVYVEDVNDNSPLFMESVYEMEVPENAHMAVITTIRATDADAGSNGHITYSIIDGNSAGMFSLDSLSGKLSCSPLDREQQAYYQLTIAAQDGGTVPNVNTVLVKITVVDDNDNDPIFTSTSYSANVQEDADPNTYVLQVTASDADNGVNSRISYALNNTAEGMFKIDKQTGVIRTAALFDREKKPVYSFEVYAIDGGLYGPRQKMVRVDISVVDVNDNAPVFEEFPYKVNISQNYAVGQYVVKVEATDPDIGNNADVEYRFVTSSPYFDINMQSGIITTSQVLDPAAVRVHRLEVTAADKGSPPRQAQGLVEIRVGNAQGIGTLQFSNLPYNGVISESSGKDTSVITVTARASSGSSGTIAYSFASGNENNIFKINSISGTITVNEPSLVDYETRPVLRLVVLATASSTNAYGYVTVNVNLQDSNDNAPRFSQENYVASVWEGNNRLTPVTYIEATDADSGNNGLITYSIIGGNIQDAFVIDPPESGVVMTKIILDREIIGTYRLEIEAIDGGYPPRSSSCILSVQVLDINDNTPFFPSYDPVRINEGTNPGSEVIQVTANDRDLMPVLMYDFTEDGNIDEAFSIDRYSGRIAIAKHLDYEMQSVYTLKVTASDTEHLAETDVIVELIDENDNYPRFSQQTYEVSLPELTPAGASVVNVNATDGDAGDNGRITYSMFSVDGFSINPNTGLITTNRTVTLRPGQRTTHLVVTARDHGLPQLSAVTAVRVLIIDVNNFVPQFLQSSYRVSVDENESLAKVLIRVSANDEDESPDNRKIDYSIVSGNNEGVFQISSTNGEIILVSSLDREKIARYLLTVEAKDRGQEPLSSTVLVTVDVVDVNDNAPQFDQTQYKALIAEDVEPSTSVLQVAALDADSGDNGDVVYSIASGNDGNKFTIDSVTGVVSVVTGLDHETQASYRMTIQAMDSSKDNLRLSTFVTVIINVTDINEFSPVFPVTMYLESVPENEPVGTSVFTAHANDKDGGFYGKVNYNIIHDQPWFEIDSTTGVVTTLKVFDYEEVSTYQFDIRAVDQGGRTARISVMVNIEPKDEFEPQFSQRTYGFEVPGNAKKGHEVGKVQASDGDGGRSGVIKYFFEEENEYFEIGELTGMIVVARDLQDVSDSRKRKRRWVSKHPELLKRSKRALDVDNLQLRIVASSGLPGSQSAVAEIQIAVNRSCVGCEAPLGQVGSGGGGTTIILVVLFVIIAVVLVVVIVILYMRERDRKKNKREASQYGGSFDSMDIHPPPIPRELPPTYNEINSYPQNQHRTVDHNITTSEISDQSHSASSGRGSAEDGDDVDEEIRMINATPMQSKSLRMPDSGIQQDDDTISEASVQNHQEYLARLGIDTSKLKIAPSNEKPHVTSSVESMHQFSEEGGGEGDTVKAPTHVYDKAHHNTIQVTQNMTVSDNGATQQFRYGDPEPTNAGSLSSVINSEEEFSGSYNWDYLLDWGPQYQPLAHVFAEIAKLKDDSIKPKKQPTQIVPQRPHPAVLQPKVQTIMPPPLLTNAPPRAYLAQPMSTRPSHSNSTSTSSVANSQRTNQMVSMPSLPRSPISHESSYTSPAMSPSFTPSLSPLATRSPISPLVSTHGINSSGQSSNHTTPQRSQRKETITFNGSTDSEQEIRI